MTYTKTCPICKKQYKSEVRHQKYCGKICQLTAQFNRDYGENMVRAPQWFLDRRLGGGVLSESQDDIWTESLRTVLKEEIQKIKDAGIAIDESKIFVDKVRLTSAERTWATVYYPRRKAFVKGGIFFPEGRYTFAFNRAIFKFPVWAWRQTVMHELLHVAAYQSDKIRGRGHGYLWKSLAYRINIKYGYNVKRTTSREEYQQRGEAASRM